MRIGIANTPVIATPGLLATTLSQTTISLTASYLGIPFPKSYNFEFSSAPNGPFTAFPSIGTTGFADSSLSASQTRYYRVRVLCQDGRFTPYSTVQGATTQAVIATGSIRVASGVYVYLDRNASDTVQIGRMLHFVGHCPVGYQVFKFWSAMENPNTPGDYSGNWAAAGAAGFQLMDRYLDALPAGKKLMWHVETYGFAGHNQSSTKFPSWFMPTYLSGPTYGPSNAVETTGVWGGAWINTATMSGPPNNANVNGFVRWWVPAVMGRIIAMGQAYAARYKNDDRLIMWSQLGESAHPGYVTYTDQLGIIQLCDPGRYFEAMRAAWPNTELRLWNNYLQSNNLLWNTIQNKAHGQLNWCGGGPDCINETPTPSRIIPSNLSFRGLNPNTGVADSNYNNFTGKVSFVSEFEPDEQMPRSGAIGPAASGDNNWTHYINNCANLQKANYITVFDNQFGGNNDKRTGGYTGTQPSHPDALDWFDSLIFGGTVNGATAGTTLTNLNVRPSQYT